MCIESVRRNCNSFLKELPKKFLWREYFPRTHKWIHTQEVYLKANELHNYKPMIKLEHIGDESWYQTTMGKSGNIILTAIWPNNQKYSHIDTRLQNKTKQNMYSCMSSMILPLEYVIIHF